MGVWEVDIEGWGGMRERDWGIKEREKWRRGEDRE